jgi:hypothetical protein
LIKTTGLRLVIIEGEKVYAGQNMRGTKMEGPKYNSHEIYQYTDLAHFLVP